MCPALDFISRCRHLQQLHVRRTNDAEWLASSVVGHHRPSSSRCGVACLFYCPSHRPSPSRRRAHQYNMLQKYYRDVFKVLGVVGAMTSAAVGLNKHFSDEAISRLEEQFKTKLDAINTKIEASLIVTKDVKTDVIVMKAELVEMNKKLHSLIAMFEALSHKK